MRPLTQPRPVGCPSEAQLLDVLGLPPAARPPELESHLDGCSHCRRLTAKLLESDASVPQALREEPRLGPQLEAPTERYALLERLGSGGMGIVYSAFDRELDRKVALKFVAVGADADGSLRLLHEGKALARLSHPNVLSLFDVFQLGADVVLSMELVEGLTLAEWSTARRRSWREVLAVFLEAGEGLAAAHAKGIVHRDVKPANMLVGADGRTRVADFGLSLSTRPAQPASSGAPERLTDGRAAIGTPAYMAPEQRESGEATPRSDQYSFCLSLDEALRAVRGVPRSLSRVIARGLSTAPHRRWESMPALLAAMRAVPKRRARAAWAAAVVATTALAVAAGARSADRRAVCAGAGAPVDAVWNPARRSQLESSLRTHQATPSAATTVLAAIDAFATEWKATAQGACESARLRGTSTERLLELQTLCLDQRKNELSSLLPLLEQVDATSVWRSAAAVQGLSAPSNCAQVSRMGLLPALPAAPELRAAVDRSRALLAEASALTLAGRPKEGLAKLALADAETQAAQYGPLRAELWLAKGTLLRRAGKIDEAEAALNEAVDLAESLHHDEVASRAWLDLYFIAGEHQADLAKARAAGRRAHAAVERLGDDGERARYLNNLGNQQRIEGRLAEAEATFVDALERMRLAGKARTMVAATLALNLGITQIQAARWAEAAATFEAARAVIEEQTGNQNDLFASCLSHQGIVALQTSGPDKAEAFHEQALALRTRLFGRRSITASHSLLNLAYVAWERDDVPRALELIEETRAIRAEAQGPEGPLMGPALATQARLLALAGRAAEAERTARQANAIAKKTLPEGSTDQLETTLLVAETLLDVGKAGEARALVEPLLPRAAERLGAKHLLNRELKGLVGRSLKALGGRDGDGEALLRTALDGPLAGLEAAEADLWALDLAGLLAARGATNEARTLATRAADGLGRRPRSMGARAGAAVKLLATLRAP